MAAFFFFSVLLVADGIGAGIVDDIERQMVGEERLAGSISAPACRGNMLMRAFIALSMFSGMKPLAAKAYR